MKLKIKITNKTRPQAVFLRRMEKIMKNNLDDLGLLNMDSVSDVLLNLLMMSDADIKEVTGIIIDRRIDRSLDKFNDAKIFKSDKHLFVLHDDGIISVVTDTGVDDDVDDDGFPLAHPIITAVKWVGRIMIIMTDDDIKDFANFPNLHKAVQKLAGLIDGNDTDVHFDDADIII